MIISRFCKDCGSKNTFDDSKEKFFCSICGAENQVDQQISSTDSSDAYLSSLEQNDEVNKPEIKTVSGFVPLSANPGSTINNTTDEKRVVDVIQEKEILDNANNAASISEANSISDNKNEKKNTKRVSKVFTVTIGALVGICLIIGAIYFFTKRIPSKYCGTYVRYYYVDGTESKMTYKITPLSVKSMYEYEKAGEHVLDEISYEYSKKGNDLIVSNKEGDDKYYLIIDDDCLYVESSKDISFSKKLGLFYWNINSDKADIYEIENKSRYLKVSIVTTMNAWTRDLIYHTYGEDSNDVGFYIFDSDEKADDTDLNTYEIIYEAANGELSLYYDRNTKELKRVYFSGIVSSTSFGGTDYDSMSIEDVYDAKALLLSLMYLLGNKDNIELNTDTNDREYQTDFEYRLLVASEYDLLFSNKSVDEKYDDRYTYSFENEKYNISSVSWISSSDYSVSGTVSFNISIK